MVVADVVVVAVVGVVVGVVGVVVGVVGTDKNSSPKLLLIRNNWECFRRPHRVPVDCRVLGNASPGLHSNFPHDRNAV